MTYHAKTQQGFLIFIFILILVTTNINLYSHVKENLFLQIAEIIVLFVLFIFVFINFKFTINENNLIYQIFFFTIPIYKKEIEPDQINQIKFIRIGWAQKGAVIQTEKGFNIRVVLFQPNHVYLDLNNFANENSVTVTKTKDYLILEKSN